MAGNDDKKISDIVKKVINTGIGAAFMTEDAVKGIIKELPLPKDVVAGLLTNAKQSKEEFIQSVKSELKNYLNKIDLTQEIDRVLEKYDFEINATISLKKKDDQNQ